jgi:putative PIN family toxin of toxin-antitoxin system
LRAVLDTNVLISALIKAGKPRRLLKVLLSPSHAVIISEPIVEEFSTVSADEKVRKYVDDEAMAGFLAALLSRATFVRIESKINVMNDPDDKVLATAKDGKADYIVTGDRHLLELSNFGRARIITVDEALGIARKTE